MSGPSDYTTWLARSISDYESLAKSLVRHKPEKGRIVESVVKTALRTILPGRFSIGTGFAITASGETSAQLDLVIYDALLNASLILEGGTGLFPIECIYGFVEVKSILDGPGIDSATKAIGIVRQLAKEKRYVQYIHAELAPGKKVAGDSDFAVTLAPRSFIFAIKSAFSEIKTLEEKLVEATTTNNAHVHGLVVIDQDWFIKQLPFQDPYKFECWGGSQALATFCMTVQHSIQTIEMYPAAMMSYWKDR
jgi:hypothetical protein